MAKRLHMTSADYLAIAISPALIMALVGSLVFFLVEVLYVGQYEFRLNYALALFVFAAVLIARISIEMGSERAVLFALPLGLVMYLFMLKFVEHPSAFSHVINFVLLGIVWWCAHKLTWDSTVIDDSEDASGEGLMQRLGVDGPEGTTTNELLETAEGDTPKKRQSWWQRFNPMRSGPHTPGTWVLYFSLAALPLFGIGQYWIPASDVGRRRYVFFLLLVYVAAALALLVSTSFLNLRRYLRQRRVEMPLPIAGTWVGVGAVLIVLVMLLAALIPRPNAEIALSRVPWQAGSPGGLSASRTSMLRDGGEQTGEQPDAQAGTTAGEDGERSDQQLGGQRQQSGGELAESSDASQSMPGEEGSKSTDGSTSNRQPSDAGAESSSGDQGGAQSSENSNPSEPSADRSEMNGTQANASSTGQSPKPANMESKEEGSRQSAETSAKPPMSHGDAPLDKFLPPVGGLGEVFKLFFYAIAALMVAFLIWRYRQQLLQAVADILRQLRELFGGRRAAGEGGSGEAAEAPARRPSFTEFRDPFSSGQHGKWSPEELVRYTFAAFEAWASDRGSPRTPDCTPQELVNLAVEPKTPMHDETRRLLRLYSQVAYASQRVPRGDADSLSTFWEMMRSSYYDRRAESA